MATSSVRPKGQSLISDYFKPVTSAKQNSKQVAASSTLWNKKTAAYVAGGLTVVALTVAAYVFRSDLAEGSCSILSSLSQYPCDNAVKKAEEVCANITDWAQADLCNEANKAAEKACDIANANVFFRTLNSVYIKVCEG